MAGGVVEAGVGVEGNAAGLEVAAVVGAGTVGVAVGIVGAGAVVVVVTGALCTEPASAPTVDELGKLFEWCVCVAGVDE